MSARNRHEQRAEQPIAAANRHSTRTTDLTRIRFARARAAEIPAGRFGTPDEFGGACAFLCSADAGYIVGQNVLIDDGAVNLTT